MWDYQPWENDRAADFFAKIVVDTGFAKEIRTTLTKILALQYIDDELYKARACSYCLIHFGRVYIWPIDYLNDDIQLCIDVLHKVIKEEDNEKLVFLVKNEIKELEVRLTT